MYFGEFVKIRLLIRVVGTERRQNVPSDNLRDPFSLFFESLSRSLPSYDRYIHLRRDSKVFHYPYFTVSAFIPHLSSPFLLPSSLSDFRI